MSFWHGFSSYSSGSSGLSLGFSVLKVNWKGRVWMLLRFALAVGEGKSAGIRSSRGVPLRTMAEERSSFKSIALLRLISFIFLVNDLEKTPA